MGVAFALCVWVTGVSPELPLLLSVVFFTVVLSAIDLEVRRLPNTLTAAFALATLVCIALASWLHGDTGALLRASIGALGLGAFYLMAWLVIPKGMGLGDVKLAPSLGAVLAWFGWPQFFVGAIAAFFWGSIVGLVVMATTRRRHGVAIPFGPWMFAGTWTGLVAGVPVTNWYLGVAGLS